MRPVFRKGKGGAISRIEAAGLRRLGQQLRLARLGRGWSQRHLERASGVDQTTISRLENGQLANLRLLRVVSLIEALEGQWDLTEAVPGAGNHPPDGR
jgi:transcriptional regulator with XRE-family HTH domain